MCDQGATASASCGGCGACGCGSTQFNAPICPQRAKQGGCGNGPCSGCNVYLDHWNCGYCSNDRTTQKAWALGNVEREAALRSGDPVIPASGNFNFGRMGAWQPFGRPCTLNNGDGSPLDVPGLHLCQVAPGVWQYLPNWVPCGAAINFYNDGAYIESIYSVSRTLPFSRSGGRRFENAPPVLNPYVWPPLANPITDLYRR